jgi:DNA-binding Xre family transcriptional regulator
MKSHVKKMMEQKGLTLREVMTEAGIANKTILFARSDQKIETCTLRTLKKIARVLEVSVNDLFTDDPDTD